MKTKGMTKIKTLDTRNMLLLFFMKITLDVEEDMIFFGWLEMKDVCLEKSVFQLATEKKGINVRLLIYLT